ncbi:BMC domain-containing protein [Faecalispora jeddahensis]|uniref:BMC domain-containing protein n=1 Tax=Faecalispora jeddahensis TaxID=1414721 RepID=UPI00189AD17B|nr:BMC domain-containing protein [Faecalispora jeddahensis]
MNDALGLVEIKGLAGAIAVADAMVKTANVGLIGIEKAKGFGWITIKVSGDVGAVTASVQTGRAVAEQNGQLVSFKVIPRPAPSIGEMFCKASGPEQAPPPEDPGPDEPPPTEDLPPQDSQSEPLPEPEQSDSKENAEPAEESVTMRPEETTISFEEVVPEKAEPQPEESKEKEPALLPTELSSEKETEPPEESQTPVHESSFTIEYRQTDSENAVKDEVPAEAQPPASDTDSPVPQKKTEIPAKKGRPAKSPGRPAKNKKKPADAESQQPGEGSR